VSGVIFLEKTAQPKTASEHDDSGDEDGWDRLFHGLVV
jgi:hypothetical protein